jgi:primase-polymerase (primpol)-like protein/Asp-tRNA(Asn)/Glu-tRNA(Gln) amidotransferase C subunit
MTFVPSATDRERFHSQKLAVLAHLQEGKTLTQEQSKELYSIMRLASRIDELRREGWNVQTVMIPAGENGACVAEYRLPADKPRRGNSILPVSSENIPEELKRLDQWVVWRLKRRADKTTKIPYSLDGSKAKSNDPRTWTSFKNAFEYYASGKSDGVGFVFAGGGGLVGIDLDKCVDESGMIVPQALKIVETVDSYSEFSVSGKGLHIIVRADLSRGIKTELVEVYPHGRYFTVTGNVFGDSTKIRENSPAVRRLVELLKPPKSRNPQEPRRKLYLCNDELVEKARAAKNGEKFSRLFDDGSIDGYASHSEADLALLSILLYWCNGDEDRADILFRQSALCRDKWTERADYRRLCFEFLRGKRGEE